MQEKVLYQLGLTKSEVKVYITLLELGSSTTGPIMDKAKVSSSKIYGILGRLIEKGLVSFIIKSKTKYYRASSPESLLDYVNEKEDEIRNQKQQVKNMIPELKLKQKLLENKQEAQIYMGWKGLMNAFNFILEDLKNGDEYIAFSQAQREEDSKEVKLFFIQYQRKREEKKLKVKLIADKSQKNVFNNEPYKKFKNFNVKYIENSPPGIVISRNNIFISTFEIIPVGVVITSKEISDSFRKYFYNEWEKAKS